jgi:TolB-like protein/Flp pilus assembly protein TadD
MRIRFDPFEVDTVEGRLLKFGVPLPLREQPLRVLLALLDRPGETVTRSELRQRLWSDATTVDFEAGLNTAISRLRDVLNDEPSAPCFIETVPKRGYRFIGTLPKQPFVAVIPLDHPTADQDTEYVADGLTEDLIGILSRIEGVRVASRSAVLPLKGRQYDPRQVAKDLGVSFLVEGSVRRIAGRIWIHVHLVNGADAFELWSERFDGDWSEVLSLHDRVADALASALRGRLTPQMPFTRSANADAYAAYTKGHYLVARHSLNRALEYFDEAIRLDNRYALPYHGAAVGHILRALIGQRPAMREMAAAERFLYRGLELAPELSMMQNTLGMLRMFQCRWQEAETAYEHAITADPRNAYAHMMFALQHSFQERHERALNHARQALALEPFDPMTNFRLVQCSYYARRYQAAIDAARSAIELAPNNGGLYWYASWALLDAGSNEEAWSMACHARQLAPDSPVAQGQAGYVAGRTGRISDAQAILQDLHRRRMTDYCPAIAIAWLYLGLGQHNEAIEWLTTARAEQDPYIANTCVFPGYDPLRSHPAFKRLSQRIAGETALS